jgi:integrase
MGRSLVAQVRAVWSASRILAVGKSRFLDKQDVRDQLRAEGVGATSARIAARTSIASYRTFDAYRAVTAEFARFAEAQGVERVQDLRPEHAAAFLDGKLAAGRSCNTLRTYAAALGKFDCALAKAPKAMRIPAEARLSPGLEPARQRCNMQAPRLDGERRAYADPCGLVAAVRHDGHRLAATLQLEAGFRVSEALGLRRASLQGETMDPVTGRWCGLAEVKGKGGFGRVQFVPLATYRTLRAHLDAHAGGMGISYKRYLADMHHAADETGQGWGGTHGLRHNYVRNFLLEAVEAGLGTETAMREAMERVGHHRLSELKTYLR